MKKQSLFKSVLAAGALLAAGLCHAQGTWQPASNNGSNNSTVSGACYLVTFDAGTSPQNYGVRSLIGAGRVDDKYFTGFLWFPGVTARGRADCGTGAVGQCAWHHGGNFHSGYNYSVAVSALPILSAQPAGCY